MPSDVSGHRRFGPQPPTDLQALIEDCAALGEHEAASLVLLALPSHPDPEIEPTPAQHIEGGELLGEHHRCAQGREEDRRTQPDARRLRRDGGEHRQRFAPVTVGPVGLTTSGDTTERGIGVGIEMFAQRDMVRHDHPVHARALRDLCHLEQR